MASHPPIVSPAGQRLGEAWTGAGARRSRLARELEALGGGAPLELVAGLHHELGRIEEQAGRQDEALAHYQAAQDSDPGSIAFIWALRRLHERAGRWDEVLGTFNAELAAVGGGSAQSEIWLERAMMVWSRLGKVDEARRCLEASAGLDPSSHRGPHRLEWLEAAHGTQQARLAQLRRVAERMPIEAIASACRAELAFDEWRKGPDRDLGAAMSQMQQALEGAAAPSAVLDALEYFAEEGGSAESLLAALEERRSLVEGASEAARLEVQSILLWSAAVAAGPGGDRLVGLARYREAIAMVPEPEMLPELIRRATWARAWSVAHAIAAAMGPGMEIQSAAYALLAGKVDLARTELRSRIEAGPSDWIARLLAEEIERTHGDWAGVAGALEGRLADASSSEEERLARAVELSELDANVREQVPGAIARLQHVLDRATDTPSGGVPHPGTREDAFSLLEELLERTGDRGRLEALWERELDRAGSQLGPYLVERLCDAAIRAGDLRRGADFLARSSDPRTRLRLAVLRQDAGDAAGALEALEAAYGDGTAAGEAALGLALRAGALALDRAQEPKVAAVWYRRAHQLSASCVEADLGLDVALHSLGRHADREESIARTLAAMPPSETWITRALERALVLGEQGRDEDALAQLEAVEAAHPARPEVAALRGRLLGRSRAWDRLAVHLAQLASADRSEMSSELLVEAAETAEIGAGDPATALDLYERVLEEPSAAALPRALAGLVRSAARIRTPASADRAIAAALAHLGDLDPEDLEELVALARHVLSDDVRAGALARGRWAAPRTAEQPVGRGAPPPSVGELSTCLGALIAAERSDDVALSAEIARTLADRIEDRAVATELRVRAARAMEVARGEDPVPPLKAAHARAPDDPGVAYALARHAPRLDTGLRAEVAAILAREAGDDRLEAAIQLTRQAEAVGLRGDHEGAWQLLLQAHTARPDHLPALLEAQEIARQLGDPRRLILATERVAGALASDAMAADAWVEAGVLYEQAVGDPIAATRCFVQADHRRPGDIAAFEALRRLFVQAQRWNELARLLTRQIGVGQKVEVTIDLLWQRALVEGWTGNIDGARRDLNAVLGADPDNLDALEWRAALHSEEGEQDPALEMYVRLLRGLEAATPSPQSVQRLATTCIRIAELGRRVGLDPAVILDVLDKLLRRRPDCPHALRHAADQALRLGQWDTAAVHLERLAPLEVDGPRRARIEMELCRIHGAERYDQDAAGHAARRALAADPLSLDAVVALVELSAWVVTPAELATQLDVSITAMRAALAAMVPDPEGRRGRLLAELAVLHHLRGQPELAFLVTEAARISGAEPERIKRMALPPVLEKSGPTLDPPAASARDPRGASGLRPDLLALAAPDGRHQAVDALWQLLAPVVIRRSTDERIAGAWQAAAKRKHRADDPLVGLCGAMAPLLAPGRLEIIRADAVPGIALGRRSITVLGDPVTELLVDTRVESPPAPAVAYRLARALIMASVELANVELVRHDVLMAAFEAARDPASALSEKLGRKERARARELLATIDAEAIERWFLDRRLALARVTMVLAPDVGSAAKELGADPVTLDELCTFVASARFEALRGRVRDGR